MNYRRAHIADPFEAEINWTPDSLWGGGAGVWSNSLRFHTPTFQRGDKVGVM